MLRQPNANRLAWIDEIIACVSGANSVLGVDAVVAKCAEPFRNQFVTAICTVILEAKMQPCTHGVSCVRPFCYLHCGVELELGPNAVIQGCTQPRECQYVTSVC